MTQGICEFCGEVAEQLIITKIDDGEEAKLCENCKLSLEFDND